VSLLRMVGSSWWRTAAFI